MCGPQQHSTYTVCTGTVHLPILGTHNDNLGRCPGGFHGFYLLPVSSTLPLLYCSSSLRLSCSFTAALLTKEWFVHHQIHAPQGEYNNNHIYRERDQGPGTRDQQCISVTYCTILQEKPCLLGFQGWVATNCRSNEWASSESTQHMTDQPRYWTLAQLRDEHMTQAYHQPRPHKGLPRGNKCVAPHGDARGRWVPRFTNTQQLEPMWDHGRPPPSALIRASTPSRPLSLHRPRLPSHLHPETPDRHNRLWHCTGSRGASSSLRHPFQPPTSRS